MLQQRNTCNRIDRNSSEKSTMLNWSENSGSQPRASITTKPPAPARLYSSDLFSVSDSMNGWPR